MHTDQIYIARNGKSGMHVLVRILAVDDIGVDYPPIDPDNFNKLMMARDVKSLVLAARDLGPMYISADILSRRTFIPSHLQQDIECGFNLIPPDLESLLSECYFDPYAIPDEIAGMGYRAIGRTGKKATRELINDFDFTIAGNLSYLDSQFRAIVEPLHDWVFARNLLSILMRIGGPEVPEIREPVVDLFRLNPSISDEDAHSLLAFTVRGPAMVTAFPANSKTSGYAFPLENHAL